MSEPPPSADPLAGGPLPPRPPPAPDPAGLLRVLEGVTFARTQQILNDRRAPASGGLLLIGSFVLFVLLFSGFDLVWLGLVVGVLIFHESGHYLGMQVFGYRNVRIFFIPFFGAATSGEKIDRAAWKEAVVLFLGPLPGMVLGAVLWAVTRPAPPEVVQQAVFMLIALNAFNLLPIYPLDGGRLANMVLFSRHPVAETVFRVAAGLALIALAVLMKTVLLGIFGAFAVFGAAQSLRSAVIAREVREAWGTVPPTFEQLDPAQERDLFDRVHARLAQASDPVQATVPSRCAMMMRQVHERAADEPPGLVTSVAIVAAFLGSWLALFLFLAVAALVSGA